MTLSNCDVRTCSRSLVTVSGCLTVQCILSALLGEFCDQSSMMPHRVEDTNICLVNRSSQMSMAFWLQEEEEERKRRRINEMGGQIWTFYDVVFYRWLNSCPDIECTKFNLAPSRSLSFSVCLSVSVCLCLSPSTASQHYYQYVSF